MALTLEHPGGIGPHFGVHAALAAGLILVALHVGEQLNRLDPEQVFLGVAVGAPPGPIKDGSHLLEVIGELLLP